MKCQNVNSVIWTIGPGLANKIKTQQFKINFSPIEIIKRPLENSSTI